MQVGFEPYSATRGRCRLERSRGDGASRAAGYLKKMRELAESNGFDASRI